MPKKIDSSGEKITAPAKTPRELEASITGLQDSLNERDNLIEKLNAEKIASTNEITRLTNELGSKDAVINNLQNQNLSLTNTHEEKLKKVMDIVAQKDSEISELNTKIKELSVIGANDQTLVVEIENLNLKYEAIKKEAMLKDAELVSKRLELDQLLADKRNLERDNASLKELYMKTQQERNEYFQELDILKKKTNSSFTSEQMSNYLSNAIDTFNKGVNTSDPSINYIINEMDVELKTMVSKNDANEMVMTAPEIVDQNAFSTVKFSIRAVPKVVTLNK